MTKVMMTGGNGRIGKYVAKWVDGNLECNITDSKSLDDTLSKNKPDIILHLAGKSDPDWCEKPENEKEAIAINVRGTFKLLHAAEMVGAKVVMLSSDHVFSGGNRWIGTLVGTLSTEKSIVIWKVGYLQPINEHGKN